MEISKPRIGIMTGGGDAPGLNGIIEATCLPLLRAGYEIVGIQDGFEGVFEERNILLNENILRGIHAQAGTLLGTSNKCGLKGREAEFLQKYKQLKIEGIVVAGGDGTFSGFKSLDAQVNIVGVPKTIDNDLSGTEITFGFDTACSVVANAVDALRATAEAHKRAIVVETMGRTAGWIALGGGLASYAEVILIPERPYNEQSLAQALHEKIKQGRRGLIVVVAEGAHAVNEEPVINRLVQGSPQAERYGGIAERLAHWIEKTLDRESRHVVLGHLQRSSHPTTTDRFLTLSMGVESARLVTERAWNQAVVYREGRVRRAPIADLMGPARCVDPANRWLDLARSVGIFV